MTRLEDRGNYDRIDDLFPKPKKRFSDDRIEIDDLPYVSRPIVEYLHESRPSAVIAADRGGRLFGLSILYSWKRHFPDEPFPTLDGKLHFARVSSRSARSDEVEEVVARTLKNAGVAPDLLPKDGTDNTPLGKVVFLDDWAVWGGTFERFLQAATKYGVPQSLVAFATMCGARVHHDDVDHIIGDPSREPRNSAWNDSNHLTGVSFHRGNTVPSGNVNPESLKVRRKLVASIDSYYDRFTNAYNAGEIDRSNLLRDDNQINFAL